MPGQTSHAIQRATNQPVKNKRFKDQKLDVKASERNAVMIASEIDVVVCGVGGGK
jgi:hypothetical protein